MSQLSTAEHAKNHGCNISSSAQKGVHNSTARSQVEREPVASSQVGSIVKSETCALNQVSNVLGDLLANHWIRHQTNMGFLGPIYATNVL